MLQSLGTIVLDPL